MISEPEEAVFSLARQKLTDGDADSAIADLRASLDGNNEQGRLWALLGVAQWSIGRVDESISSLETAQLLTPIGAEGRLTLAQAYEATERRELAADLYATIAVEETLPSRVLPVLADCLWRTDQLELAVSACQEAAQQSPGSAWPYKAIACFLSRMGKSPAKIASVLKRACQLDPEDADIRLAYAQRLHQCGNSSAALDELMKVDVDSICCASCLRTVREIFVEAGDAENAARCIAALWALSDDDGF